MIRPDRRAVLAGVAGLATLAAVPFAAARGRTLTLYFTRTGNTGTVARLVHRAVGGDILRVVVADPYPDDYEATVDRARVERDGGDWPALAPLPDLSAYDTLFLGAPVWGDHLNPPMKRFLADHDLAGVTIAPFVTYEVSRTGGRAAGNVRAGAPRARVRPLLAVLGEDAAGAEPTVTAWLGRIGTS